MVENIDEMGLGNFDKKLMNALIFNNNLVYLLQLRSDISTCLLICTCIVTNLASHTLLCLESSVTTLQPSQRMNAHANAHVEVEKA